MEKILYLVNMQLQLQKYLVYFQLLCYLQLYFQLLGMLMMKKKNQDF